MARVPVNQPYTVTTPFGVPDPNALFGRHSGIDYAVPLNRPVYSPASGQLRNIVSPTGGNMVKIFDGKYYHRLMHNDSFSRGDGLVNEGDEVAKAGTTGLSTGVHVHWDVSSKEVATSFSDFVNPDIWLKQGGTVKPTREQVIHTIQIVLGYTPGEAEIQAQMGQASIYDVVKSLGDAAQKARAKGRLSDDQKYSLIKGMTGRDVTQAEAANREYNESPGLAVDTFYNNGGKQRYERDKAGKAQFEQLAYPVFKQN